jgi:eukaryotic-like serine/threonine-protein kinase
MAAATPNVREIFLAALDLLPSERAAYLEVACGGDAALRQRVETLLRAHDEPGPFLSEEGAPTGGDTSDFQATPESSTVLAGRYKLIEEIGEGGMGAVWMARQTEPVKRFVAVKLIKAGMDSRAVLARFEAERQALALMDHPNIAKVYDAGTTPDGRPFFVMELVKGVPITKFCDDKRLTLCERLELFVPVCQAIQHAHQKGIIHRDIKPSNVLVALFDDKPVPKVIDFGVAKATGQQLTEKTFATGFGAVVGTPEYMSPEQASFNNLDIDTRSDVYALGVLLYELLAGSPPFSQRDLKKAGLLEILRVVREVEPPRPSTKLSTADALPTLSANRGTEPAKLTRSLRGELDWIVMKSLEKDRARRYDSANSFAADVQRYLASEPVLAVPPSSGYRLRKFVKRNRAAVLTAGVFALVLLVATGVSIAFGLTAKWAGGVAEQRRLDAESNEAKAVANEAKAVANEAKAVRAGEQLRDARDELWASLYIARCPLIHGAWDAGEYDRVRKLLAAQVPAAGQRDVRGFEWHYLDRQINADLRTVVLAPKDAYDDSAVSLTHSSLLRLSPDGTRLLRLTRSDNNWDLNRCELWLRSFDTTTGREQFAVQYPGPFTYGVSYSPDGKWIVAASPKGIRDHTCALHRWDATNGTEDRGAHEINSDQEPLAGPDTLPAVWRGHLWNGKAVTPISTGSAVLAVSPDGSLLAIEKDGAVELIDTRTGQPLSKAGDPRIPPGSGSGRWVTGAASVAFSADCKRLVVAGEKLTVWEVSPRRKLAEVAERASRPVFSPDGTRIAYVRQAGVVLVEADFGQVRRIVRQPDAVIAEAATGRVRRVIKGHDGGIECVAFNRDGSVLVTAGPECVKHWDATLDERVPALKDRGTPSADGQWVGRFDDPVIKVWKSADDAPLSFKVGPLPEPAGRPKREQGPEWAIDRYGFTFTPDGLRAVMGFPCCYDIGLTEEVNTWDCHLRLWDLAAGRELMGVFRLGAVTERAFSPDGRFLVALYEPPGEAMVWNAITGRHLYTLKLRGHNFMLAFSSDGSRAVAVGGEDGLVVTLWDPETGRPVPAANVPYGKEQGRLRMEWLPPALGPGGKRLAAFVRKDAVSVWDTETGGNLVELKGVKGLAPSTKLMAFSPDGHRLVTCSKTGALQLWDPDTGTELLSLNVPAKSVYQLTFTPDGRGIRMVVKTDAGIETHLLDGSPRTGLKTP